MGAGCRGGGMRAFARRSGTRGINAAIEIRTNGTSKEAATAETVVGRPVLANCTSMKTGRVCG